jgi:hypothetical protein
VDSDVLAFAQVMMVIMISLAAFVVIGLGARILWRLGSRASRPEVSAPTDSEEIQRLQTAVDAIAIEVERISEAQRFTVTLLSNRLPPATPDRADALPVPGTRRLVDTPH